MRGDIVYRVHGVHEGRAEHTYFGTYRTRTEAERQAARLVSTPEQQAWAAKHHNRGFAIVEHVVETSFEVPPLPKPRDRYTLTVSAKPNRPGTWDHTRVEVYRREPGAEPSRVCGYERNYSSLLQSFEPFRQGGRELALISRDYTRTAVLDLASGEVICEEPDLDWGFCPAGFYVPDWWDVHDEDEIPGSKHWSADSEWPCGDFGFVWGCVWGDDSAWKVQYLDLSRVQEGVLIRDDRFGYVQLATGDYTSPCIAERAPDELPSSAPDFIQVSRRDGVMWVRFALELAFDLASGRVEEWSHAALGKPRMRTSSAKASPLRQLRTLLTSLLPRRA